MSEAGFPIAIRAQLKHGFLWEALRKRGWTQKQGAEFIGISQTYFGMWLSLKKRPKNISPQVAVKLFELTGKSIPELWPEKVFTEEFLTTPKTFEATRTIPVRMLGRTTAFATLPAGPASDRAEQGELRALIARALSSLTPRYSLVIRRHIFDGKNFSEIGKELGVSRSRAAQLYLAGVRRLQHPVRTRKLREHLEL